ncbi:MAG TPA: low affinity iron permease family protein [Candidatus Eremiobacteraceae bacterium]
MSNLEASRDARHAAYHEVNRLSRMVDGWCAHPIAAATVFALVVLWVSVGPAFHFSDAWQFAMNTTSSTVTFLMVFVIANAQKRDTDALLLKMDLLIAADPRTKNTAVEIEAQPEHVADEVRKEIRELQGQPEVDE